MAEKVTVYVQDQDGDRTGFVVRSEAPWSKIENEYIKRKEVAANSFVFLIAGNRVNRSKTIAELGLDSNTPDDNVVEAMIHQAGGEVDDDEGDEKTITLKVRHGGDEVAFKVKKTTKFSKIFKAFCDRKGVAVDSISFVYDGKRLNGDHAPKMYEMEDDDVIDAMIQQQGGVKL